MPEACHSRSAWNLLILESISVSPKSSLFPSEGYQLISTEFKVNHSISGDDENKRSRVFPNKEKFHKMLNRRIYVGENILCHFERSSELNKRIETREHQHHPSLTTSPPTHRSRYSSHHQKRCLQTSSHDGTNQILHATAYPWPAAPGYVASQPATSRTLPPHRRHTHPREPVPAIPDLQASPPQPRPRLVRGAEATAGQGAHGMALPNRVRHAEPCSLRVLQHPA